MLTASKAANPCSGLPKQREEEACRERVIPTAVGKYQGSWPTEA